MWLAGRYRATLVARPASDCVEDRCLQLAPATELLFGNRVSEGFFSKGLPSDLFTVFKTFASARAEYLAFPPGEGRMLLSAQESSLVSEVENLPSLAGIHRAVDKAV